MKALLYRLIAKVLSCTWFERYGRQRLRLLLYNCTPIAVVGHLDLVFEQQDDIRKRLTLKLKELVEQEKLLVIVTGLATGADYVAAQVAVELGIPLFIILPMPEDRYKSQFNQEGSFLNFFEEQVSLAKGKYYFYEHHLEDNTEDEVGYEWLASIMASISKHSVVLSDGVQSGARGGTSDYIHRLYDVLNLQINKFRKQDRRLYQLVVARQRNLFPVGQFQFHDSCMQEVDQLQWIERNIEISDIEKWEKNSRFNQNWRQKREILLKAIIPFLLGITMIVLGTLGFWKTGIQSTLHESFFRSFKLFGVEVLTKDDTIALNDSSFKWLLSIARWSGVLLSIGTYILAVLFVVGSENLQRLMLWVRRNVNKFCRFLYHYTRLKIGTSPEGGFPFYLIIGLSEKGFDVALDLVRKDKKVVILNHHDSGGYRESARNYGMSYLKGNPMTKIALRKSYFNEAEEVYIMGDSDEENIVVLQGMDEIVNQRTRKARRWYVHLQGEAHHMMSNRLTRAHISTFNVTKNIVRKLFVQYRIDRFTEQTNKAIIVVIGFGNIGRSIVLTALEQCHYIGQKSSTIRVFYEEGDVNYLENFKRKYSAFFEDEAVENNSLSDMIRYVFQSNDVGHKGIVEFLPLNKVTLVSGENEKDLYDMVEQRSALSLYVCLESGLDSVTLLTSLLPRLGYLANQKNSDVRAFYFYNFPDLHHEDYVEIQMNALAPHLPIYCFGNFLQECRVNHIKNEELDCLSSQLQFWYYMLYDFNGGSNRSEVGIQIASAFPKEIYGRDINLLFLARVWEWAIGNEKREAELMSWIKSVWDNSQEVDRESSRKAADHIWIKLRQVNRVVNIHEQQPDVISLQNVWTGSEKKILGELEHRRWCAEKLIDGFKPLPAHEQANWSSNKKELKKQKLHQDLIPFNQLDPQTQEKDYTQIQGIPFFLLLAGRIQKKQYWLVEMKQK